MKIAIADSDIQAAGTIRRILLENSSHDVIWEVYNGNEAVEMCLKDKPDLILIDVDIQGIGGVETTKRIMESTPCAVLMVGSPAEGNTSKVFLAMGFGALDVVDRPVRVGNGQLSGEEKLLGKIKTIAKLIGKKSSNSYKCDNNGFEVCASKKVAPLIVIGASTGGPSALASILSSLPAELNAAIVIIQHVDAQFAPNFKVWLNDITPLKVKLADEGGQPEIGTVLIAGTNDHLVIKANLTLGYTAEPANYPFRPSVDVFFRSASKFWPEKAVAILLTGMGRDGAKGLLELRNLGWYTIAQAEKGCSLFGMPKEAAKIGAAVDVLQLEEIVSKLISLF